MGLNIINKKSIKIAILLFPFFTFALGLKWQVIGMLVNAMRYLSFSILGIWMLSHKSGLARLFKMYIFDLVLLLFFLLALASLINGKSISYSIKLLMYAVIPFAVFNMFYNSPNWKRHILEGTVLIFEILNITNLIFMIVFKDGIYQTFTANTVSKYYLFGAKNQMVAPVITGMFFLIEYAYNVRGKITRNTILLCSIHFIELLWGGSGTGLLMFAIVVIFVILKQLLKKYLKIEHGLSAVFVFAVGIVLLRIQNIFSYLIEDIMHKSLTLSNRTFIWDAAISLVKSNFLLGYGVGESLSGDVFLDMGYMSETIFAHDMFLDYLVMGGILSLVIFIMILLETQKYYRETRFVSKYGKTFIWIGILVYLFASIVEIYTGNYCLFIMIAYVTSIGKQVQNIQNIKE